MPMFFLGLRQRAQDSLWLVPTLFAVIAIIAALVVVAIDNASPGLKGRTLFFDGGPDASRVLLSTIAAATLGATTLVFSVTMLVLQLASSQFSPRLLRTFLRDPYAKFTLGIFIATFAFSLVAVANAQDPAPGDDPPSFAVSMTVAILLAFASVAALVMFIHHTAQSIRAANIIKEVAEETHRAIQRLYPESAGDEADPPLEVPSTGVAVGSPRDGVLVAVNHEALMEFAEEHDIVVEVRFRVGEFIARGSPVVLLHGYGSVDEDAEACIGRSILLGPERTLDQDAAFGFRQLVDIAARALSPGVNDPTTAVQALDRVYAMLQALSERSIPSPLRVGESGDLRLILPRPGWDDYVHLGFDELIEYGASSSQVRERLYQVLDRLESEVPEARRAAIRHHRRELDVLASEMSIAHGSAAVRGS